MRRYNEFVGYYEAKPAALEALSLLSGRTLADFQAVLEPHMGKSHATITKHKQLYNPNVR